MNIDEIALRVWYANNTCMPADGMNKLKEFAHALLAELSKDAEPVARICSGWQILFIGSNPIADAVRNHDLKIGDKLFTSPPNTADIEQRVSEAIAKMAEDKDVERTDYCMHVYEEGEQYKSDLIADIKASKWREYL